MVDKKTTEAEEPDVECSPSECYSHSECVRPPTACLQRWGVAGQEGYPPCLESLPSHSQ